MKDAVGLKILNTGAYRFLGILRLALYIPAISELLGHFVNHLCQRQYQNRFSGSHLMNY